MKLVWMKFFPADWLADTVGLSAGARGVWFDTLCLMSRRDAGGELTHTAAEWAGLWRVTEQEAGAYIRELETHKTATVTLRNSEITLLSRRLQREHKAREAGRIRARLFRRHARVTALSQTEARRKTLDARGRTQEVQLTNTTSAASPPGATDLLGQPANSPNRKPTPAQIDRIRAAYPGRLGNLKKGRTAILAAIMSAEWRKAVGVDDPEKLTVALIEKLGRFTEHHRALGNEWRSQFIQHLPTWFHQGGYLVDESEWLDEEQAAARERGKR